MRFQVRSPDSGGAVKSGAGLSARLLEGGVAFMVVSGAVSRRRRVAGMEGSFPGMSISVMVRIEGTRSPNLMKL